MLFFLKKLISAFLMPFPFFLITLLFGLRLVIARRRRKLGLTICIAAGCSILGLSLFPVAKRLMHPLERGHPLKKRFADHKFIAVLGGGHISNPNIPLHAQMSSESLARIIHGISLYHQHTPIKLITSGYSGADSVPNAEKMSSLAINFGVRPQDIIVLSTPRDTEEESQAIAKIVGEQAFYLVTSASHMQRALGFFKQQGLFPTAAPAHFYIKDFDHFSWKHLFPSAHAAAISQRAIYEYLGLAWQRLKRTFASLKESQDQPTS